MSWLADRLGVHVNLRPYAAAAGGLIGGTLGSVVPGLGTALGAGLGAGLFKTADNKLHGDSWTHALGQGALNGGIGYLGAGGLGKLRAAFGGGGEAAGAFAPSSSAVAPSMAGGIGGDVMGAGTLGGGSGAAGSFVSGANPGGGSSFLSGLGGAAKSAGSWLGAHPSAVSGGLQGLGEIGQMDSTNALRRAQASQLGAETAQAQQEMEAKKRRDAALAPLWAAFAGQMAHQQANPYQIAANPYSSGR